MDTAVVVKAGPVETLYMTVPRVEMRKLTAERDALREQVALLKAQLQGQSVPPRDTQTPRRVTVG